MSKVFSSKLFIRKLHGKCIRIWVTLYELMHIVRYVINIRSCCLVHTVHHSFDQREHFISINIPSDTNTFTEFNWHTRDERMPNRNGNQRSCSKKEEKQNWKPSEKLKASEWLLIIIGTEGEEEEEEEMLAMSTNLF